MLIIAYRLKILMFSLLVAAQGISSFDQTSLKPVKTLEPLSGSELATQEIVRKEIGDQLTTFDRYGNFK